MSEDVLQTAIYLPVIEVVVVDHLSVDLPLVQKDSLGRSVVGL
jgi:hypothetical protein